MTNGASARAGVFIVFEGIDGAGTSTQIERYAAHLRREGRGVHVTREPSTGPIGVLLRQVLNGRLILPSAGHAEVMALLFAADRLDHLGAEIVPHLQNGSVVLSDRYDLSSLAYQSISGSVDGRSAAGVVEWIRSLNRAAQRPDVTVLLDVDADVAAARRQRRGGAPELFDGAALQARLAVAYRNAEELVPGDRVLHVDGNPSSDEVSAAVVAALAPFIDPAARP
jgi:dTMP kinase